MVLERPNELHWQLRHEQLALYLGRRQPMVLRQEPLFPQGRRHYLSFEDPVLHGRGVARSVA